MHRIHVRLVRLADGRLVGADVSSRWNLEALGVGPIVADRNQRDIKRLRRMFGDFAFEVVRGGAIVAHATEAERAALGDDNASRLALAA